METCPSQECEEMVERHCYLCGEGFCAICLSEHLEEFHNQG